MRKQLLLLSGFVLLSIITLAQRTITGKVTDDKNNPVGNVSVIVKGTTSGTTSKSDGTYSLTIPANARALIFSSVDMVTTEKPIGSLDVIDVSLKAEDKTFHCGNITGDISFTGSTVTSNYYFRKGFVFCF